MAEYTYEDVIIDPEDPRLEGAIGKECYFGNELQHAIDDANENNNLAILEIVDSSRPSAHFGIYIPSYNDRCSVTCIILKKEEQMLKYTYKDIIIDPTSEEAKSCIGKMVYFADNPTVCLESANDNNGGYFREILDRLKDGYFPFVARGNDETSWACIIPCKEEPKPERA